MPKYEKPASLPEVDGVEVLALGKRENSVQADEHLTQYIAELWRKLPPGEQSRCHVPPFALRFFADGGMLLEASICWQCDNIWLREGEAFSVYEFDGSAEVSRELLDVLTAISKVEETKQ